MFVENPGKNTKRFGSDCAFHSKIFGADITSISHVWLGLPQSEVFPPCTKNKDDFPKNTLTPLFFVASSELKGEELPGKKCPKNKVQTHEGRRRK